MNTTKFRSMFPSLLTGEILEDSLLDSVLFNNFYQKPFDYEAQSSETGWDLKIPFPGACKDDIDVEIKENNHIVVSAKGESVWGKKQVRSFKIPSGFDVENIEGEMRNGILRLFIPKRKSVTEKKIQIK